MTKDIILKIVTLTVVISFFCENTAIAGRESLYEHLAPKSSAGEAHDNVLLLIRYKEDEKVDFSLMTRGDTDPANDEESAWNYLFGNNNNARIFLTNLTRLRYLYPFELSITDPEAPLEYALKRELYYQLAPGLYVTPRSESFRRHIVFAMDSEKNIKFKFEVMIPGNLPDRREIGVDMRKEVSAALEREFPGRDYSERVLFSKRLENGSYNIYGCNESFNDDQPLMVTTGKDWVVVMIKFLEKPRKSLRWIFRK